jgi:hypothetical protein
MCVLVTYLFGRGSGMSQRIQIILDEKEASEFKAQAMKESKSLSAWLREAGKKMVEMNRQKRPLSDIESLETFFKRCNAREKGVEPDWEEHKRLILDGSKGNTRL